MRVLGATDRRGAVLGSYLLFESAYTCELISLGHDDALKRRAEVVRFFTDGP